MDKMTKRPSTGRPTETKQSNYSTPKRQLNKRAQRALNALLIKPVSREELDTITSASNSPDIIFRLRHGLKISIETELKPFITRDGTPSRYGIYHLKQESRNDVLKLLRECKQ